MKVLSQTNEFIAKAELVLCHDSSAINSAILYNKILTHLLEISCYLCSYLISFVNKRGPL
jgi:hypothetical protein